MKKLLLVVLLIAGALGYLQHKSAVDGVRNTAQALFDDKIEGNVLKVGYVDAPTLASIPIIGQSTWRSYFFIAHRNGDPVDLERCPGTADYEVQLSDRRLLVTVFHMDQLRKCSDALKAKG